MAASHIIAQNRDYLQRIQQIAAILFLIVAVFTFVLSNQVLGYIISSFLLLFSFILMYQTKKSQCAILDVIKTKPKSIVWIYHHELVSMPFGVKTFERNTLYVYTIDKKYYTQLVRKKDVVPLLIQLEKELPQATFGFSIKKEQLYRANPALLLK